VLTWPVRSPEASFKAKSRCSAASGKGSAHLRTRVRKSRYSRQRQQAMLMLASPRLRMFIRCAVTLLPVSSAMAVPRRMGRQCSSFQPRPTRMRRFPGRIQYLSVSTLPAAHRAASIASARPALRMRPASRLFPTRPMPCSAIAACTPTISAARWPDAHQKISKIRIEVES